MNTLLITHSGITVKFQVVDDELSGRIDDFVCEQVPRAAEASILDEMKLDYAKKHIIFEKTTTNGAICPLFHSEHIRCDRVICLSE